MVLKQVEGCFNGRSGIDLWDGVEVDIEFDVLVEILAIEKISVEIFYDLLGIVYHIEE